MAYIKPELVVLVFAAQAIHSLNNHDFQSDKGSMLIEGHYESTSTSGAYEVDE
jgi:hypothetical protein